MPAQAASSVFEFETVKQPAVILASERALYAGVTRIWSAGHGKQEHVVDGFTKKYEVTMLAGSKCGDMESAIRREKQIKAWKREWKIRLIEESNPYWNDPWLKITG